MLEDLDEHMDSTDAQLNSVVKKVEKILDNISGVFALYALRHLFKPKIVV